MITNTERRALYLILRHGMTLHSVISQGMARSKKAARQQALANLEALGLISSAKQQRAHQAGRPSLTYWLTDAGKEYAQDLIDRGEMQAPPKEKTPNV